VKFNLKPPMHITGKMSERAANASGKIIAAAWLIPAALPGASAVITAIRW